MCLVGLLEQMSVIYWKCVKRLRCVWGRNWCYAQFSWTL